MGEKISKHKIGYRFTKIIYRRNQVKTKNKTSKLNTQNNQNKTKNEQNELKQKKKQNQKTLQNTKK